jgi:hypothetical protein
VITRLTATAASARRVWAAAGTARQRTGRAGEAGRTQQATNPGSMFHRSVEARTQVREGSRTAWVRGWVGRGGPRG